MLVNDVEQQIIKCLQSFGPIELDENGDCDFLVRGYLDSLSTMKFLMQIETIFGIQFLDEELLSEEFGRIKSLSQLIHQKMSVLRSIQEQTEA